MTQLVAERGRAARAARAGAVLSARDWRRITGMVTVVVALHVVGFGTFLIFVFPAHYKGLGIGIALTAYTLGMRHAFDADHISAIDNVTRKLINDQGLVIPRVSDSVTDSAGCCARFRLLPPFFSDHRQRRFRSAGFVARHAGCFPRRVGGSSGPPFG